MNKLEKTQKIFEVIKQKIGLLSFCLLCPMIKGYYNPDIPKYIVFIIGLIMFIIIDSISSAIRGIFNNDIQKQNDKPKERYIKKGENLLDKMDDSAEDADYAEKFLSSVKYNDAKKQDDKSLVDITEDIAKEVTISDDEIYNNLGIKF